MSKSDAFETAMLEAVFNNDVSGITGLLAAGANADVYVSLHTADPGEAGDQTTNEVTTTGYENYARVAVTRATGFTVTGNSVSPAADISFPESGAASTGAPVITHFGVGTAATAAGVLLYKGAVTPNVTITAGGGTTPRLTTASAITED